MSCIKIPKNEKSIVSTAMDTFIRPAFMNESQSYVPVLMRETLTEHALESQREAEIERILNTLKDAYPDKLDIWIELDSRSYTERRRHTKEVTIVVKQPRDADGKAVEIDPMLTVHVALVRRALGKMNVSYTVNFGY